MTRAGDGGITNTGEETVTAEGEGEAGVRYSVLGAAEPVAAAGTEG